VGSLVDAFTCNGMNVSDKNVAIRQKTILFIILLFKILVSD
jgi:hypothetical protein